MAVGCDTKSSSPESENLLMHLSFDSTTDNKVVENVSNKQYDISYVFSSSEYKAKANVPTVQGINGNAVSFDGNSTSVRTDKFETNNSFTFSLYLAPRAYERNDGQYTSIFTNNEGFGGFDVAMAQFGIWKVTFVTTKGTLSVIMSDLDKRIPLYDWSHIAIRYNSKSSYVDVFLNGQKVGEMSLRDGLLVNSQSNCLIGQSYICSDLEVYKLNHFNGLLDDLKIYDGVLTESKIQELGQKAKDSPRSPGIVFSYETLADCRYVPQYHMRNPRAWANEFYGGMYYNGKYHIFSQNNPFRPSYQNGQRWGHLVSDDLVHWNSLVPALTPSDNRIDNSQCFSGSTMIDGNGKPIMFYTGVNEDGENFNTITYALPHDLTDSNLETWDKSNTMVVSRGNVSTKYEFRDPFIYKENNQYFMLVGANNSPVNPNDGAVVIYKADNAELTKWNYLGICYSGSSATYPTKLGSTYELPNLFKLTNKDKTKTKYMLMVSPIYGQCENSVTYWLGSFNLDTGVFTPDNPEPQKYDLGAKSQILAASGFYDEHTGRNLFTTMMRSFTTSSDSIKVDSNDLQTLWKEIYLDDSGNVRFTPIEEYRTLEKEKIFDLTNCSYSLAQANNLLSSIHSDSYKLEIEIEPNGDSKVGLQVKYSASKGEQVLYTYDTASKNFYCDTSKSSLLLKNHASGGGVVEIEGNVKLTMYVDRSLIEGYLNDTNEISTLVWSKYKESDGIRVYSNGTKAAIKSLKLTTLSSAYGYDTPAYWGE